MAHSWWNYGYHTCGYYIIKKENNFFIVQKKNKADVQ